MTTSKTPSVKKAVLPGAFKGNCARKSTFNMSPCMNPKKSNRKAFKASRPWKQEVTTEPQASDYSTGVVGTRTRYQERYRARCRTLSS